MLAAKICGIMPASAPAYGRLLGHGLTGWPVARNISSQAVGRPKPALLAWLGPMSQLAWPAWLLA